MTNRISNAAQSQHADATAYVVGQRALHANDRYSSNLVDRLGHKTVAVAASVLLAAALVPYSTAWADSSDSSSDTAKTEVVYSKADASGDVNGVYVVNGFQTDDATKIKDPGTYEQVINLSTTSEVTQKNGKVSLTTAKDEPFYYEGILNADTQLPWNIEVTYTLDGKNVNASDLANASGDLEIKLAISPNEEAKGSTAKNLANYSDNYLVQAQGTFDNDTFEFTSNDNAMLAHVGDTTTATCMVLPGESETFTLKGKATNFSYDGWQIAGLSLNMAIDLADQDLSELTDATEQLSNAVGKAKTGAAALASGTVSLSEGISKLNSGLGQLSSSNDTLLSGWSSLKSGIDSAASGASQLADGSDTFKSAIDSATKDASSSASKLSEAKQTYKEALDKAQAEIKENGSVSAATFNECTKAAENLATISGNAGAYQALSKIQDGYSSVDAGISQLDSGLDKLSSGASSFDSGLSSYTDGVAAAASGSSDANDGADTLADGADQLDSGLGKLSDATSGLDEEIVDKLQDKIDDMLGKDYQARSFVDSSNKNVSSVQFIYVLDGVTAPDDETSSDDETDTTLFDRIAAVFSSIFSMFQQ